MTDKKTKCCNNCIHWVSASENEGECKKLSQENPQIQDIGIIGYPICGHDGPAVTFETAYWFSCFYFSLK